jgi:hypothetical protein
MSAAPPSHSRAAAWTLGILAALLAYALSLGPVFYLEAKGKLPPPLDKYCAYFYYPVLVLERSTPLRGPFTAYLDWWYRLAEA